VKTAVTAVSGTLNSCEIGSMISRKIVKSKASKVHPSQAATQASHWSLVGSFHHGMGFKPPATIVIRPFFPCEWPLKQNLAETVGQESVIATNFFLGTPGHRAAILRSGKSSST
jgi:hypothetical protein